MWLGTQLEFIGPGEYIAFQKTPVRILVHKGLLRTRVYLISLAPGFWRS
jgi:hypothetical protein